MRKHGKNINILKILMTTLVFSMFFSVSASDYYSYELVFRKIVPDDISIYEYDREGVPIPSGGVVLDNPLGLETRGIADIYITTSRKMKITITSDSGYKFTDDSTGATFDYILRVVPNYSIATLQGDDVVIVNNDEAVLVNEYALSLKVTFLDMSTNLAGNYQDTLKIVNEAI